MSQKHTSQIRCETCSRSTSRHCTNGSARRRRLLDRRRSRRRERGLERSAGARRRTCALVEASGRAFPLVRGRRRRRRPPRSGVRFRRFLRKPGKRHVPRGRRVVVGGVDSRATRDGEEGFAFLRRVRGVVQEEGQHADGAEPLVLLRGVRGGRSDGDGERVRRRASGVWRRRRRVRVLVLGWVLRLRQRHAATIRRRRTARQIATQTQEEQETEERRRELSSPPSG